MPYIRERDFARVRELMQTIKELTEKEFKEAVAKIKKIVSASALMYLLSLEVMGERAEVHIPGERGPSQILEFAELRGRLRKAIEELPLLEKEVIELFYRKEMTQKDLEILP